MKTKKERAKHIICATLNGRTVSLWRKGKRYFLSISGSPLNFFSESFGDCIRHIEKSTGVAYPF